MFSHGRKLRVLENLSQMLANLRARCRTTAEVRRVEKQRARFWAGLREGEREAEARSGS